MTKRKLIILLVVFTSVVALVLTQRWKPKDEYLPVALKAIQSASGWGYEIDVDGKPFIRQANIPAISGNLGFSTKEQALAVGNHAVEKLKNGKLPQITVDELKDWGVVKETRMQ